MGSDTSSETLRDSQARLAGIIDSAMDAVIKVDHFVPRSIRECPAPRLHKYYKTTVLTRRIAGPVELSGPYFSVIGK